MTFKETSLNIGRDCFTLAAIELIFRERKKRENVTGIMLLDKAIEVRDKLINWRDRDVESGNNDLI